jgi:hypothetical protein
MIEAKITDNTRSYFKRPLSTNQKRIHSSAEEVRDAAVSILSRGSRKWSRVYKT